MRAPEAPIGWPSAQAPPCTLTISCGSENSCIAAIVTAEGELQACQADTGSDMPDVTKIIQASVDALEESLRSGEARLTGLAINVNIPAEIEAPCRDGVRMDFCSGPMISTVYFPYKVKRVGLLKRKRKVEFSKAVTAV